MKKLIVCPKESGNTYKVCRYVSSNSNVDLNVVATETKYDLSNYDVIILASGVYMNNVHKDMLTWIQSIEKDTIKANTKVYLFLTWFGRGNSDKATFDAVKALLQSKGITLEDNYMKCFGKGMGLVRMSHPNEEDCKNVLSWANTL
jgi:flavodoxin